MVRRAQLVRLTARPRVGTSPPHSYGRAHAWSSAVEVGEGQTATALSSELGDQIKLHIAGILSDRFPSDDELVGETSDPGLRRLRERATRPQSRGRPPHDRLPQRPRKALPGGAATKVVAQSTRHWFKKLSVENDEDTDDALNARFAGFVDLNSTLRQGQADLALTLLPAVSERSSTVCGLTTLTAAQQSFVGNLSAPRRSR